MNVCVTVKRFGPSRTVEKRHISIRHLASAFHVSAVFELNDDHAGPQSPGY